MYLSYFSWKLTLEKDYNPGDDQFLIALTGFNVEAFEYLLEMFATVYDAYTP